MNQQFLDDWDLFASTPDPFGAFEPLDLLGRDGLTPTETERELLGISRNYWLAALAGAIVGARVFTIHRTRHNLSVWVLPETLPQPNRPEM